MSEDVATKRKLPDLDPPIKGVHVGDNELEVVFTQTPFMLTWCTRDLRYRFVSQAYAEMMGRQPSDIAGQAITDILGERGFATIRPYVETVLQGTRVDFECEIACPGGLRSLRVVYIPETDARGCVHGWIASILDISERKRADDERAWLLASAQAARAQAEEANRSKDRCLAAVSHELRTPLNAILGWASVLEQTRSPTDARMSKGLQSICRNTKTLAQLVDDLLDVSRIISDKMRIDLVPMDLGDVIDAAVEAVLSTASAKQIEIDVVIDPDGRSMIADPIRLQQAVGNLLSNAVKFTPEGGRVDVSARVHHGDIEIAVSDTGIGIDATFLPHVFDRFRQADDSTTRGHGGLGLGLAIVRHLVELHGGTVHAESEGPGAGTRFVIQLPRNQPSVTARDGGHEVGPASAIALTSAPRLDGLHVLIVDDDRESCEVALEVLQGYGASLRVALSAGAAVEALSERVPDLVLTDIAMPAQDGYAVLSEVRALEATIGRRVPVAAVTANAHPTDRERAMAAGFDDYLAKPIQPAALARAVAALAAVCNH